jgi:membrane protein required for colicin V production
MSLAFTYVDLLAVGAIVISMILALWRGFVSETLAIVAWAAAAFASLYFGSAVGHALSPTISPLWLALLAGYALVFAAVVVPISFASSRLSDNIRHSSVGPLDRTLGAAFGIARGFVIVGGLYLLFSAIVPIRDHPMALQNARLLPVIQSSAQVLIGLAPSHDRLAAEHSIGQEPVASARAASPPATQSKTLVQSAPKAARKPYGAGDRRALDRLIEATGSSSTGKP